MKHTLLTLALCTIILPLTATHKTDQSSLTQQLLADAYQTSIQSTSETMAFPDAHSLPTNPSCWSRFSRKLLKNPCELLLCQLAACVIMGAHGAFIGWSECYST